MAARKVTIKNNPEAAEQMGADEVTEVTVEGSAGEDVDTEVVLEESVSVESLPDDQEIWDGGPNAGMIKAWKEQFGEVYVTSITFDKHIVWSCLLYTSPSPRDRQKSRMPSSA